MTWTTTVSARRRRLEQFPTVDESHWRSGQSWCFLLSTLQRHSHQFQILESSITWFLKQPLPNAIVSASSGELVANSLVELGLWKLALPG
jgi:hypothetical protein